MRLGELLDRLPVSPAEAGRGSTPDLEITGVQEDSRLIGPGNLFIARRGEGVDGKQFVRLAADAGAVAIVADEPLDEPPLPTFVVPDAGAAASIFAHALAGEPTTRLKVLGVTGTNGKTTTTFLVRHILGRAGVRCGMIGTCEIDDGLASRPAAMTTPGPVTLAEILASMAENGCQAVAMEASSHALAQGRARGVHFSAAGFTNLTGDHLDYHENMEAYAEAKSRLFMHLAPDAPAVVNCHDRFAERMLRHCPGRPITFGVGGDCIDGSTPTYSARDIVVRADGSHFNLHTPDGSANVHMKLVGRHNVENALCAAAIAAETFGLGVQQIAQALGDAAGAPGRLQRVDTDGRFDVFVDYAHTDDALSNVLQALKPITEGNLRLVFGCGGDRDRSKRPRMAQAAEAFADEVYVTSDNPRTEDPRQILDDIVAGFTSKRPKLIEPDRRLAIQAAVTQARPGDVVLIAGKGHETYQIVGRERLAFDDVEEARAALALRESTSVANA